MFPKTVRVTIYDNGMNLGFFITVGFPIQENLPLNYSDLSFIGKITFQACP